MTIDLIKKLYYEEGLSSREIGKRLGKTAWQVINLMKKSNLKLRSSAETQKIQFIKKPLSFNMKSHLSSREKLLYYTSLMLYWAEGTKTDNRTVDLANSDENIVVIFLRMLNKIFRVDKKRLRILLYCYANQNTQLLIQYWSKKLKVPKSQFIKPYIRQDYNENKIHKMPHGLVHVRYNDKKLFMKIWEEIGIIQDKLLTS